MPTAWFNSIVFTQSFSVFKIVVILIGYKKRWSSFFSKKCPFVFMWVDGVRHKNLMVVNGMGGKFVFVFGFLFCLFFFFGGGGGGGVKV